MFLWFVEAITMTITATPPTRLTVEVLEFPYPSGLSKSYSGSKLKRHFHSRPTTTCLGNIHPPKQRTTDSFPIQRHANHAMPYVPVPSQVPSVIFHLPHTRCRNHAPLYSYLNPPNSPSGSTPPITIFAASTTAYTIPGSRSATKLPLPFLAPLSMPMTKRTPHSPRLR